MRIFVTQTNKDMKNVNIIGIRLQVKSDVPLPTFCLASAEFSEKFPGIFSIEFDKYTGLYELSVSSIRLLEVFHSINLLAEKAGEKIS